MAKKVVKKKVTQSDLRDIYDSCFEKEGQSIKKVTRLKSDEERLMLKDPQWAYLYSKYVKQEPWSEEDEKVFFTSPKWAYLYSVFVNPSESIKRHMIALAIKDKEDEWAKKYFDKDTGVDAIRAEFSSEKN